MRACLIPAKRAITGVLTYWREVASEVGPERVLFATGAPFTDPGIYVSNVVKNCLFYRNDSYNIGGGVLMFDSSMAPRLENCTMVFKTASNLAGGFHGTNGVPRVLNSIIYNNQAGSSYADVFTTNALLTNCCFKDTNGVPNWNTNGNITNNPQFVDTNTANYRLTSGSPCINTGTNQSWMTSAVDLDGHRRIVYGIVDMGAYETIYEGSIYRIGF